MTRSAAHSRAASLKRSSAKEEQHVIETAIRRRAAEYPALRRVLAIDKGDGLDLHFFVAEPFSAAEDQVLPLVSEVLRMSRVLDVDFMIAPAGAAENVALSQGARPVYEYGARSPE
ncbi:MAG TPA: hypothetical protein VFA70_10900 [Dehalococcoidia bacterium]|nr:hypothetical protein [Dehalococcoidia bacterium]